ncbi:Hypothetical protein PHPALM_19992 [Phytophthora palmivora]|uniref:Uncharacterized protein n=1 Tax=Phytophthora palmivora TaxID=4796 RepID=A0A2P4XG03_9STRA|nr:Hypothetical protein PHPALM_19992 [Phytophthora palmivora]
MEKMRASPLIANNIRRLNLMLETLRSVNSNITLRAGEYDESKIIEALVVKTDMQTTVNAQQVNEAISELYQSTKCELSEYLVENREQYHSFTVCAEFWTCKTAGDKHSTPHTVTREGGIQKPFRSWPAQMLETLSLPCDFYGSTSDADGYVKYMLRSDLKLKWEWREVNPEMADLIAKMTQLCKSKGKRAST